MAPDLQRGTQLGHYRIERVIGRGGMGVVYLARDLGLDRYVALKILSPELADNDTFRERFTHESTLAAAIEHANIIPIYDAGEVEGVLFIAMRYVQGRDLRAILADEARLDLHRAIAQVGTQVARALDAAHLRGLVHRDVKPGNVLVTSGEGSDDEDHCYLADFGLTRQTASLSTLTGAGQFVGTLSYIPPEQIQNHSVDGRSDQYALAAVLFECLTGRPPFVKDNDAAMIYAHLEETPPRVSVIGWDLPEALDPVFERGLAKEKQDRFDSCGQLVAAAREAAGFVPHSGQYAIPDRPVGDRTTVTAERPSGERSGGRSAPSGQRGAPPSEQWRRRALARNPATWWIVGVAAVVITALVLFLFLGGGDGTSGRAAGPPPESYLYTLETGVGAGGTPGALQRADAVRGTAASPGWSDEQTLAFVERSGSVVNVDVATLGNKGKIRVQRQFKLSGSISHLTWSPDGSRLAFVRTAAGHSSVESIGPAGGGLKTLADPAGGARDPAYAPNDGRVIAFESSMGGPYQIWTMTQNGENRQARTGVPGGCSNPTWSDDGHRIVFVCKVGAVNQMFMMARNGAHQRQLTQVASGLSDPAWARDGTRVYFVQNVAAGTRLAAVDVKTQKVKPLTGPMTEMSQPMVPETGDIVFFVAQSAGVQQLFELRLAGGLGPTPITGLPGGAFQPALSPGGATMAFASRSTPVSPSASGAASPSA
jgi:serine/threonine-protein kinase